MKFLTSLFFLIVSIFSFGQHKPTSIELVDYSDFPFAKANIKIDNFNNTSDLKNNLLNITKEHWDTTTYNPYRNVKVNFPLEIKFSDSLYTPPINFKKVVTSRYGWRRGRAHRGIDIDLVTGDSVVSMFDGIVRLANYTRGHGRTVIVRHYNGLETVYAHLSKYAVKANDTIKHGQLLGYGGASGNARGSHLHLVINYKGISINPEYLFDFSEQNMVHSKNIWVTKNWVQPGLHSSKRQTKLTVLHTKEEAIASLETRKKVYIVKRGDTLSGISSKNNVSIASICRSNYIRKTTPIKIGQKLILEYTF
ncbi:M23 family metallopeptidase [Flavivirga rizhaonensis]|uniref:LysM peptidoglycan-binding domain-containing protein n=1 Tax=Flavivirga rizhaonensis TaxID=2559571 RepID=A0A4S1DUB0_9FLAO|nr:M23 family metallopeptidase [Flavivirga rizhaonensis]TGV01539.1 LysM peptidoglycan-binding domain-containing protein [Flavivirga rizhaonensis]